MSGTGECDDVRSALGVYVLGAVEPAGRRLIDQHLTGCARCRNELAGLAGLPALLGKVSADEVASAVAADALAAHGMSWPSGRVLRSQLIRVARTRRHHLLAWIGAAVVAGAVAGSVPVAIWHARQPAARLPMAHQLSSQPLVIGGSGYVTIAWVTNPHTGVSAAVRYAPQAWGLLLGVRVRGVALGVPCRLEVIDALGRATTAGGWTIDRSGGTWYPGSSWLSIDDVSGFIVASADGKPLVVIPLHARPPRHGDGARLARLLPHDRRSAPLFGENHQPARPVHQSEGSYQIVSRTKPSGQAGKPARSGSPAWPGSSGHATSLVLADPLLHPSCLLRC